MDYRDPVRGFREPGEWGPKQPGSLEQDAKITKEQGAEEINLGSMWSIGRVIKSWCFIP